MTRDDDTPEGTGPLRNVRMSTTLFEELGASAVTWGEPDAEGFYTPTIHTATWDRIRAIEQPLLARIAELEAGLTEVVGWARFSAADIRTALTHLRGPVDRDESLVMAAADLFASMMERAASSEGQDRSARDPESPAP